MGGKSKQQANRTKNNVRPSSSGRSAERLGAALPPFAVFSGAAGGFKAEVATVGAGCVGATAALGAMSASSFEMELGAATAVDSNFQVVLKKMSKKDSTTKVKALNEFAEIIRGAEPEAVKAVLGFWAQLYGTLATDTEHRVREAANVAHREVVVKVKRNIAPHLKTLAGPWFTSQFDTYAPAATAAQKSFSDAFPPAKQTEALVFCQDEILEYCRMNITEHSPQSLCSPNTTADAANAKYERVMIASLQGYKSYLERVPAGALAKRTDLNSQILSNGRFLKVPRGAQASPAVRSAWFGVVAAACERSAATLLAGIEKDVVTNVFSSFDDGDVAVSKAVWDALVLIVANVPDWWTYINVDKLFLPKLWKVLREGGQGNASMIFSSLLLLLNYLPPVIEIDIFYPQFFENIRTGMKKQSTLSSRAESSAISSAFVECLQCAVQQASDDLSQRLIVGQLFPTIEWFLRDNQTHHKLFFNQLNGLVQYWYKHRSTPSCSHYDSCIKKFWTVQTLCEGVLCDIGQSSKYDSEAITEMANKQIELILSLRHVKSKKQLKVKFDSPEHLDGIQVSSDVCDGRDNSDQSYLDSLNDLVFHICNCYVRFIESQKCKELLEPLASLLQEFASAKFIEALNVRLVNSGGETVTVLPLYTNMLSKWMKSSYLCSKPVVDIIFLLFPLLGATDKEVILNDFGMISRTDCLGWCINKAMAHPYRIDAVVQSWLKQDRVSDFMVNIAVLEVNYDCSQDFSMLLRKAFNETNDEELLISKTAVSKIMSILSDCLLHPQDNAQSVDACAMLSAYLSAIVYSDQHVRDFGDDLLLALIELSCTPGIDTDTISMDTRWETLTAWQDAVNVVAANRGHQHTEQLTRQFYAVLGRHFEALGVEAAADKLVCYVRALTKDSRLRARTIFDVFMGQHDQRSDCRRYMEHACKVAYYITGRFISPYEALRPIKSTEKDGDLVRYIEWFLMCTRALLEKVDDDTSNEDDENEEGEIQKKPTENSGGAAEPLFITLVENPDHTFADLLYLMIVAQSYAENYQMLKGSDKISSLAGELRDHINALYKHLLPKYRDLHELIAVQAQEEAWLWTLALRYMQYDLRHLTPSAILRRHFDSGRSPEFMLHLLPTLADIADGLTAADVAECQRTKFEHQVALRSVMNAADVTQHQIAESYEFIQQTVNDPTRKPVFFNINFNDVDSAEFSMEACRVYTAFLESPHVSHLGQTHWGSIAISLAAWADYLNDWKDSFGSVQQTTFVVALSRLFVAVTKYVQHLQKNDPTNANIDEWLDIFAENTQQYFISHWLTILRDESASDDPIPPLHRILGIQHFTYMLGAGALRHEYMFRAVGYDPKAERVRAINNIAWTDLLSKTMSHLVTGTPSIQVAVYHILKILASGLVKVDGQSISNAPKQPQDSSLAVEHFRSKLIETHGLITMLLNDFRLGEDSCKIEPHTDSYRFTLAYLLIWDVLLTLCEKSSTDLRFQYADWLKKDDFFTHLLNNLFKMIPIEVLQCSETAKVKPMSAHFDGKLKLSPFDPVKSTTIDRLVCGLYTCAVAQMPASVRLWWSDVDSRTSQIVDRVTRLYVSTNLCAKELEAVANHEATFKNMKVKTVPLAREVQAFYTIDDIRMDLIITLPSNYPLGAPNAESATKLIGGTSHRQWLMQLRMCLQHQNGRIWDALLLWNSNLDKKFDGVEECYICFATLHQGTYQLPRLTCSTCRKKFHSACLYKWFSTSHKSTCPICRNLF